MQRQGGFLLKGFPMAPSSLPYLHKTSVHASIKKFQEAPSIDFSSLDDKFSSIDESLKKTHQILGEYMAALKVKENTVLHECELEEELFYLYHLFPLWKVWINLLQTDEVVAQMDDPPYEKKVQEVLFYHDVTEKFCHARKLPI